MPATTRFFHVNGPCLISVGLGGTAPTPAEPLGLPLAGTLSALGISTDGVQVEVTEHFEAVRTDTAGPQMAADKQRVGLSGVIRAAVVDYDDDVLDRIMNRTNRTPEALPADPGGNPGELGDVGRLVGTSGDAYRVVLSGSKPYRFYHCHLDGASQVTLSTKVKVWRLTWSAFVFVPAGADTAKGLKLYDRTAA